MSSKNQFLQISIKAALEAGKKIMEIYGHEFSIELKADNSPLTIADREAHRVIATTLVHTGLPLLSEEGKSIPYAERKSWELYWLVDPLDGTKEFIKRNGDFTVNIALIENQLPVLGVIYIPVTDMLYFGTAETGSYVCKNASSLIKELTEDNFLSFVLSQSSRLPIYENKKPYTIVASRSHLSPETEDFIGSMRSIHGDVALINKGSSLKICLVAEGSADIYPRLAPTMEWDIAAGHAIAAFAGCTITGYESGIEMRYNKENLLNPFFIVSR